MDQNDKSIQALDLLNFQKDFKETKMLLCLFAPKFILSEENIVQYFLKHP